VVAAVSDARRQYNAQLEDEARFLITLYKPDSTGGNLLSSLVNRGWLENANPLARKDPAGLYHRILMLDVCDPRYHVVRLLDKDRGDRFRNARQIPTLYSGSDLLQRAKTTLHHHVGGGVPGPSDTAREYHTTQGYMIPADKFSVVLERQLTLETMMVKMTNLAITVLASRLTMVYDTARDKFHFTELVLPMKSVIAQSEGELGALQTEFTRQCGRLSERFHADLYVMMHVDDTEHRVRCVFGGEGGAAVTVRLPKYEAINEYMFDRQDLGERTIHNFAWDHEMGRDEMDFYATMGSIGDTVTRYLK
jgi:hypothetical protein